jgi:1-acyl-sn-glycerol-3-phosphate acyltransferase
LADIKPQVYKDPRPAEAFTRYHQWTRTHKPGWTYELARMVMTPPAILLYRCLAIGAQNVPASGPFILASNHFSNMDHFFAGVYLRRKIQFLAKSQLFGRSRVLTYIFRVGGVFPVRRGHHDDEAFVTAHSILDRGGCVLIYAEGGRSRSGALGEPRPGVGRLALESGVPVVPVAIHGSLGVRKWRKLRFPKVTVQYAEPITFDVVERPTREQQLEAATRIFEPVRGMYAALERSGRRGVIKALRRQARGAAEAATDSKLPAGRYS